MGRKFFYIVLDNSNSGVLSSAVIKGLRDSSMADTPFFFMGIAYILGRFDRHGPSERAISARFRCLPCAEVIDANQ